ncbi:MAG: hypothetical protein PF518_00930 [Spirochaetaceae bacterium]|jgi:hypothetical protein|nr:hypothetical protein [Spirochaetaceae bacterium]
MAIKGFGHFPRLFSAANIELKFGINRKKLPLKLTELSEKEITYHNEWVYVKCRKSQSGICTSYSLSITNLSKNYINMANLPSNIPGILSSEMYSVIMDLESKEAIYAEYLKEVINTFVHQWGFEYLKCDFLFTAALRGAVHHELSLSKSSIIKSGLKIVSDSAGPETRIIGCGMPIPSGIGYVDAMRVGPDTGDFWIHYMAGILRTGSMVGVRNSIRNIMVRSPMHKRLWLNDPDCLMIRDKGTDLSPGERLFRITT